MVRRRAKRATRSRQNLAIISGKMIIECFSTRNFSVQNRQIDIRYRPHGRSYAAESLGPPEENGRCLNSRWN